MMPAPQRSAGALSRKRKEPKKSPPGAYPCGGSLKLADGGAVVTGQAEIFACGSSWGRRELNIQLGHCLSHTSHSKTFTIASAPGVPTCVSWKVRAARSKVLYNGTGAEIIYLYAIYFAVR
jgi:hypothetical protein